MNFHRSKRDKQTKACWDLVCLLFMVGACKVYSVIDGNDLSQRKPGRQSSTEAKNITPTHPPTYPNTNLYKEVLKCVR